MRGPDRANEQKDMLLLLGRPTPGLRFNAHAAMRAFAIEREDLLFLCTKYSNKNSNPLATVVRARTVNNKSETNQKR